MVSSPTWRAYLFIFRVDYLRAFVAVAHVAAFAMDDNSICDGVLRFFLPRLHCLELHSHRAYLVHCFFVGSQRQQPSYETKETLARQDAVPCTL